MFNKSFIICLLLLGCVVNKVTCKIQLNLRENTKDIVRRCIGKCVLTIAEQEFHDGDFINLISSNQDGDMIYQLYKTNRWTMFVHKLTQLDVHYLFNSRRKTDNYIIHFNHIEDLRKMLVFLKISPRWNPFARFIVTSGNPLVSAANITENMWMYRILNAIIMLPSSTDDLLDVLDIYTWYPYSDGNCANNFTKNQLINQCLNGVLLKSEINLFPDKIPNDLKGCYVSARPIDIQPFVILPKNLDRTRSNLNLSEGLDIMLLNTVAAVANFRVNYTISLKELDWGVLAENQTAVVKHGLMKSLIEAEVDVGIGCVGATDLRCKYLDYTIPYMDDAMAWCVPHALPQPKWKCLFNIFHPSTWALTLVTLLLASLCQWALSYNRAMEFSSYRDIQSCSSNTFSVLLGVSVATQPRTGYNRIFFIIWIIFSLHLTISYVTSLIGVLTLPSYEKQISTLDELFESKIPYGFSAAGIRFYESQDDWRSRKILREWIVCKEMMSCMKSIAYARNYAFCYSRLALRYHEAYFLDSDGRPLTYIFRDNVAVFPVVMLFSRGFPLTNRINNLVYRIKEAGLIAFWFKQLQYKKKINVSTMSATHQKLSLFNVQGAFVILGCGLILASIVFGIELVIRKWKRKTNA